MRLNQMNEKGNLTTTNIPIHFSKLTPEDPPQDNHPVGIDSIGYEEMLAKAFKMNLSTLAMFFFLVPRALITIYYENCPKLQLQIFFRPTIVEKEI